MLGCSQPNGIESLAVAVFTDVVRAWRAMAMTITAMI